MRNFIIALALLVATAAYVQLHPPVDLALGHGVLQRIPQDFGPWKGEDYSLEDAVLEELKADDTLLRRYRNDSGTVWLCLIYHQNRRYGAHDPLLCYDSQGYLMEQKHTAHIDDGSPSGLTVNTFVATRPHDTRVVWYWWSTDGLSTQDAEAFRRQMALRGALDNRSWGAFVRVESVVRKGDVTAARARVSDFAGRVAREMPAVFAGDAAPSRAAPSRAAADTVK
jgi:EpsI family protein